MKNVAVRPSLGRCLLAGLFTGILTAVIVLIFNVIYRRHTHFYSYDIVMPFSIFLAFPLLHLVTGGIYHLFVSHLRGGRTIFTIVFILITIISAFAIAYSGSDTPEPEINVIRGLFVGLDLIAGIMGIAFIPFFATHSRIFLTEEKV